MESTNRTKIIIRGIDAVKIMESFLVFFYILDQCYDICLENDLGGFLGSISPELWENGKPIDPAIYNDWKLQNGGKKIDEINIIKIIYDFLEFYEKRFGFNFVQTKNTLINNITNDIIKNAIEYARHMNRLYSYKE